MKLFDVVELVCAWCLIYFGLWLVTGKLGIVDWRTAVFVIILIIVRSSAFERGKKRISR